MTRGLRIIEATRGHAHLVAANMPEAHRAEIKAGWGKEPEPAIVECLLASSYARALFYDLEVLAIYGVVNAPILGHSAAEVWCFGTTAIARHPVPFARASRRVLAELHTHAPILTNLVDVGDEQALKWLAFLDARYVLQPRQLGGKLFQQFILARECPPGEQCQQG